MPKFSPNFPLFSIFRSALSSPGNRIPRPRRQRSLFISHINRLWRRHRKQVQRHQISLLLLVPLGLGLELQLHGLQQHACQVEVRLQEPAFPILGYHPQQLLALEVLPILRRWAQGQGPLLPVLLQSGQVHWEGALGLNQGLLAEGQ